MQALRRRSFGSAVPAPSRRSCLPSRRSEDCCKVELKPRCADAPFRSLLGAPPQRCCALLMASMNFIDGLTSLAPLSASLAHRRISSSAVENATLVPQVQEARAAARPSISSSVPVHTIGSKRLSRENPSSRFAIQGELGKACSRVAALSSASTSECTVVDQMKSSRCLCLTKQCAFATRQPRSVHSAVFNNMSGP